MIYHYAKMRHNPPKSYGNCLQACIASIFNVTVLEDVPHFAMEQNVMDRIEIYTRLNFGLRPWSLYYENVSVQELLHAIGVNNSGLVWVLVGEIASGINHAVVCRGTEIIHNPSPWPAEIVRGPYAVLTFVPEIFGQ